MTHPTQILSTDKTFYTLIAIIRHIKYLDEINQRFDGKACYDFHEEKVSAEHRDLLRIICNIGEIPTSSQLEQLDILYKAAL